MSRKQSRPVVRNVSEIPPAPETPWRASLIVQAVSDIFDKRTDLGTEPIVTAGVLRHLTGMSYPEMSAVLELRSHGSAKVRVDKFKAWPAKVQLKWLESVMWRYRVLIAEECDGQRQG